MQTVVLNGEASNCIEVLSGLPQGSVLGPILFLVYINTLNLSDLNTAPIWSKFADDSKVGRHIINAGDADALQAAIKHLEIWGDTWQMSCNAPKCSVIHFGSNNPG